eukprot:SAG11_NODE_497_length_8941_cov_5.441303_2_plen_85_part_00
MRSATRGSVSYVSVKSALLALPLPLSSPESLSGGIWASAPIAVRGSSGGAITQPAAVDRLGLWGWLAWRAWLGKHGGRLRVPEP